MYFTPTPSTPDPDGAPPPSFTITFSPDPTFLPLAFPIFPIAFFADAGLSSSWAGLGSTSTLL